MMKLQKNEGKIDRLIRAVLGVALILGAYFWLTGWLQILVYVFGLIALITALTGFCGLYVLLKINTNTKPENKVGGIEKQ